MSLTAN